MKKVFPKRCIHLVVLSLLVSLATELFLSDVVPHFLGSKLRASLISMIQFASFLLSLLWEALHISSCRLLVFISLPYTVCHFSVIFLVSLLRSSYFFLCSSPYLHVSSIQTFIHSGTSVLLLYSPLRQERKRISSKKLLPQNVIVMHYSL